MSQATADLGENEVLRMLTLADLSRRSSSKVPHNNVLHRTPWPRLLGQGSLAHFVRSAPVRRVAVSRQKAK